MPTNLPPDAKNKWAEVEAARYPKQKLQKMQEFLSYVPKHKGTMKLRGQIKKKMAVLRKEMEERKLKRSSRSGPKLFIEKEGAAQVALLGLTKTGKSCLLSVLTNANVVVSTVPYSTREPVPSIMNFEDVQFQIVEAPALMEGSADGRAWGLQTLALARSADGLLLMLDLNADPIAQLKLVLNELEKARILVSKPKGRVSIDRKHMGASLRIILVGKLIDCTMQEIKALLKSYRITDAVVKISGEATLDDVEDAIFESTTYRPAVIVANKLDLPSTSTNLRLLEEFVDGKIPIVAVSCEKELGLKKLGPTLFKALGVIRIYTKEPGDREASKHPFTLRKGATVNKLAKSIHTDFERDFAFAKIWAKRLPYSPKKVGLSFTLEDGDIVELHVR